VANELDISNKVMQDTHTARLLYLIHGATFVLSFGLLSIIPLIFNYMKRSETQDSFVHTHHTWMINSWWIYIGLCVLAGVLFITIIGIPFAWLLFIFAWLYKAYRLIKGFIELNTNRAI
jgi:uncharacterized membrane protein